MPTTPEKKNETIAELEKAKLEIDKSLESILDNSLPDPDDLELERIAAASRAVLDINGVC